MPSPPNPPGIAPHPNPPPVPPPPFSIIPLLLGPMVCIIMPKRRLPILAFIISSMGANWVIMSPPPPPKPPNWAFAGAVVRVNNTSSAGCLAHHLVSSGHVPAPRVRRSAGRGANGTHPARSAADRIEFCEKDHVARAARVARGPPPSSAERLCRASREELTIETPARLFRCAPVTRRLASPAKGVLRDL